MTVLTEGDVVRLLASSLAIVALSAAGVCAGPLSEDVPVPGGTVALARAIGLSTPPEPSRFVSEIARLAYGIPDPRREAATSVRRRLTAHLDAAAQWKSALNALGRDSVTLSDLSSNADRDRVNALLELAGFRLRENRGVYTVQPTGARDAAARSQLLSALGVDLDKLDARLNAGETLRLAVPTELVPIPLGVEQWSALLKRRMDAQDLFGAIFAQPQFALLAYGLSGLDDDTLQFVGERPSLIAALAQIEVAPVFAAFGSSIRIKNGVVVPSGGEPMMALWQAALREDSGRTEPFVLAILTKYEGRLAYLYDLISQLDARHAAFATAASIDNARIRAERFAAFADFVAGSLATWQVRAMPFTRPIDDVAWLLLNTVVDERGTVAASLSSQLLWMRIFESSDVPDRKDAAAIFRNAGDRVDIDAVWLALNVLTAEPRVRAVRLRQLAFAMRTLSSATTSDAEVLTAVRGFARYPALMLTLERAGVASPGVFADAARRADRLARLDGADAYVAFRQFQGAIALIERMARVGSINAERTEALVSGLAAIDSDGNGHYNGTLAAWTREQLVPSLEEESTAEDALIAQLSGSGARRQNAALERVNWEGEQYRLDLAMAESRRLHELRQKLRGVPLDASLDLEAAAQQLQDRSLDLDRLSAAVATVKKVQQSLGDARFADTKAGDGLELPSPPAVLDRAVQELSRITRPQDVRDAADVGKSLLRLSGQLLGETLASFSYLVNIDTTAEGSEQAGELSLRHEFGLALKEAVDRRQTPWVLSRQVIQTGVPRHVQGSLFGLDVAFARTAMRQVVMDSPGGAPGLMSNDRETFVRSVALLNPSLMENDERDQIARALARGRTRVAEAAASAAELTALAEEVGMDGWRRRAMNWERARDASRIASFFTLNELFVLGRTGDAVPQWKLDAWGMSGMPLSGCLCTRLLPPNIWRVLGGRPQAGSLGAAIPELNLHVAEMLSALRLPAALARLVLGAAVYEFVERVRPNDADDWWTLSRAAPVVSRQRIEDYVAAATADGPLVPEASYEGQH